MFDFYWFLLLKYDISATVLGPAGLVRKHSKYATCENPLRRWQGQKQQSAVLFSFFSPRRPHRTTIIQFRHEASAKMQSGVLSLMLRVEYQWFRTGWCTSGFFLFWCVFFLFSSFSLLHIYSYRKHSSSFFFVVVLFFFIIIIKIKSFNSIS